MMKNFLLVLLLIVSFTSLQSQEIANDIKPPKWVPKNGYWVAEQNIKEPRKATFYFYTNDHQLVYKEVIQHKRLNLNKKKTLLYLQSVVETAVALHRKGQAIAQDQQLLANLYQR